MLNPQKEERANAMLQEKIATIDSELADVTANFDRSLGHAGQWTVKENGITRPATEQETLTYQNKRRELRMRKQMLEEEAKVMPVVADPSLKIKLSPKELHEVRSLFPLVNRRHFEELWPKIKKQIKDGTQFMFHEKEEIGLICNCPPDQLLNEYIQTTGDSDINAESVPITEREKTIKQIMIKHTEWLNEDHGEQGGVCLNPKKVYKFQPKHSIGNRQCKGCLTTDNQSLENPVPPDTQNYATADEARRITAEQNVLWQDWCPNFRKEFRHFSMTMYLDHLPDSKCYAGILHSQMTFEHRPGTTVCDCDENDLIKEYETNPAIEGVPEISQTPELVVEHMRQLHVSRKLKCEHPIVENKTVAVIERKCDTCDFSEKMERDVPTPPPMEPGEAYLFDESTLP